MDPETPTRRPQHVASQGTPLQTPVGRVLQQVERLTPQLSARSTSTMSPFGSPALLRLDENSLRDRLREAYGLLKEKERNLFLAATVGQELVEANQQLHDDYQMLQHELTDTQQKLKQTEVSSPNDEQVSRLHGRRKSMHLQQTLGSRGYSKSDINTDDEDADSEREKKWAKVHVQPIKAQLELCQERTDELLVEREELGAQVYELRQEISAALRRASESSASATDAHKRLACLEEEKARLHDEIKEQRSFWARRWSDHKEECNASMQADKDIQRNAERHAEDAAARIRAEQRANGLQMQCSAAQAEIELLRSQMQRMEEERVNEWEPMRTRWLASEEALQELQETHQSTCDALAQVEVRLAELDKGTELHDPIKRKSEKTSMSLLGELDMQRHQAVSQQQALAREHTVLKRAYGRAMHSQSRMKQQVARLTQLAATGANEARMKRLEAALGEAECQHQALLWANMEQRRPFGMDIDTASGSSEMEGTALITTLRARLKQVSADRDQAQRELRTAHLLRANEIQKTRDLEREVADTDSKFRRTAGELTSLRSEHEVLRRTAKALKKQAKTLAHEDKLLELDDEAIQDVDHIPPRKRTISRADLDGDLSPRRSGPMSLSFMINADRKAATANELRLTSSPVSSHDNVVGTSRSKKRRRISRSPGKMVSNEPRAAVLENGDILAGKEAPSELKDAADHSLKSWLGALGATHSSSSNSDAIGVTANTATDPGPSTGESDQQMAIPEEHDVQVQHARTNGAVDEIYIGSRMAQKPIECNNQ
ncbi:hypothetical protein IWW46_003048 [Coemansia sp. RSA 2440]|nr:hypothetical protein IWW46_003048 [Coemansia sp. RSA 2440]